MRRSSWCHTDPTRGPMTGSRDPRRRRDSSVGSRAQAALPERLGVLLPQVLAQTEKRQWVFFAIQKSWRRLVGKSLAVHACPVGFRRGRLIVHVDRPGEGFALSYKKTQLLSRLQTMTHKRVTEIVIRAGEVNQRPHPCATAFDRRRNRGLCHVS